MIGPEEVLVTRCARCGKGHPVHFVPLTVPLAGDEWTHVGLCPTRKEPVLFRYHEGEEPRGE